MKRIILLVVLFLVVGIATFGQTAFIKNEDGAITKVLVQELPKIDTLCIIEQDLSTIPGTAEQQLWALENPGMDTMVYKKDTVIYSEFGLTAHHYDSEIWITSDEGLTLDSYPNLTPKGDRPAWELFCLFLFTLFTFYLAGRFKKLEKKLMVKYIVLLLIIFIFGMAFGFIFEFVFGLLFVLLYGLLFFFTVSIWVGSVFIILSGFCIGFLFGLWWVVVFYIALSVVGYLLGYYTTKKKEKTAPLEAVETNEWMIKVS